MHLAIIMDGNRRWAKEKGLPILSGHRQGIKTLKSIVKRAPDCGVKELTVFAFSTENWYRLEDEVSGLLKLIEWYLKSEVAELNSNDVRLKIIGCRNRFSNDFNQLLDYSEGLTKTNSKLKLNVALNYGGKFDIVDAVRNITEKIQNKDLELDNIDESLIRSNLQSSEVSDIDFLIRTSGEKRISNFLFWQLAYSEILFLEILWPDFNDSHLQNAIKTFNERDRRFGSSSFLDKTNYLKQNSRNNL